MMAENDLIHRVDAMKAASNAIDEYENDYSDTRDEKIRIGLNDVPAVDAVEIIRCEDCKWLEKDGEFYSCANPTGGTRCSHPLDWFCADGERRTDDGKS